MARRLSRIALTAVIAVGGLACGGPRPPAASSPSVARGSCSAGRLPPGPPGEVPELPEAVAVMRRAIVAAAKRCDYSALQRIALRGSDTFSYSFGQPSAVEEAEPAAFWTAREEDGTPVLSILVRLLDLPHATQTIASESSEATYYLWPSAFAEGADERDWDAVEKAFGDEVERWRRAEGYVGWRAGITSSGDWVYFVAGD